MRKKRDGGGAAVESDRSVSRTRRGGGDGGDHKPVDNVEEVKVPDMSRRVSRRDLGKRMVTRLVKRKADRMEKVVAEENDEGAPPGAKKEINEEVSNEVDSGGKGLKVCSSSSKRTKLERNGEIGDGGGGSSEQTTKVKREVLVVEGNPLENKEVINLVIN